jgi:predicted esterase
VRPEHAALRREAKFFPLSLSRTAFYQSGMRRALRFVAVGALLVAGLLVAGCTRTAQAPMTHSDYLRLTAAEPFVAQDSPIFDGDDFPRVDFVNRDVIRRALGNYTLNVRYFDANYNEVTKASAPGRYGAWAEIRFPDGITDTRHITLYKTPAPFNEAQDPYQGVLQFPAAFGLKKDFVEHEHYNVNDYLNDVMGEFAPLDNSYGVVVAALHDMQADPARWEGESYWSVDDAWWCGLWQKIGVSLDYRRLVHLPDGYDQKPDQRWPVIIFLHGSDQRGDDLDALKSWGPLGYINQGHPLPFIIVTPICPANDQWSPMRVSLLADEIEKTYRVDPKRIYLTGLSMGGYAVFDTAAEFPRKFAAIAAASGGAPPDVADRIKSVPTWIYHGADDSVVPPAYSVAIADRMKQLDADVHLTIFPNVGHGPWDLVYNQPQLYDWFLQHSLP